MDTIKCASINARGLRDKSKRLNLFRYLTSNGIDVGFIQETYCTAEFENDFKTNWKGKIYHSFSKSVHSKGVCIVVNENLCHNVISTHNDENGRKIVINVKIKETVFSFICVYAPNREQDKKIFLNDAKIWCQRANLLKILS